MLANFCEGNVGNYNIGKEDLKRTISRCYSYGPLDHDPSPWIPSETSSDDLHPHPLTPESPPRCLPSLCPCSQVTGNKRSSVSLARVSGDGLCSNKDNTFQH